MTPRITPNASTTAPSRQARSAIRARTARIAGLAPSAISSTVAHHSRSPVRPAAGTVPNIRAASPAPTWTLRMPVPSSSGGGTRPSRSRPG